MKKFMALFFLSYLCSCNIQNFKYYESNKFGIYVSKDSSRYYLIERTETNFNRKLNHGQGTFGNGVLIDKYKNAKVTYVSSFQSTLEKDEYSITVLDVNGNIYSKHTAFAIVKNDTIDLHYHPTIQVEISNLNNKEIEFGFYKHFYRHKFSTDSITNFNTFTIKMPIPSVELSEYFDASEFKYFWTDEGIVLEGDTCKFKYKGKTRSDFGF